MSEMLNSNFIYSTIILYNRRKYSAHSDLFRALTSNHYHFEFHDVFREIMGIMEIIIPTLEVALIPGYRRKEC